jgi:hypothetical protein
MHNLYRSFGRLNEAKLLPDSSFFEGNVFDIDADRNILYDRCCIDLQVKSVCANSKDSLLNDDLTTCNVCRIYVGAGIRTKPSPPLSPGDGSSGSSGAEAFFLSLLKPGGLLVAPVDQFLMKLQRAEQQASPLGVRATRTEVLYHVRYNEIQQMPPHFNDTSAAAAAAAAGRKLVLKPGVWEAQRHIHQQYSAEFQSAAVFLHLVHRFGVVRARSSAPPPAPIRASMSMTYAPRSGACVGQRPALERVPVELWREVGELTSSWSGCGCDCGCDSAPAHHVTIYIYIYAK